MRGPHVLLRLLAELAAMPKQVHKLTSSYSMSCMKVRMYKVFVIVMTVSMKVCWQLQDIHRSAIPAFILWLVLHVIELDQLINVLSHHGPWHDCSNKM